MFKLSSIIAATAALVGFRREKLSPTLLGAPDFAGQHTNRKKNAERRLKAKIGARQFRKQKLAFRRAQRATLAS